MPDYRYRVHDFLLNLHFQAWAEPSNAENETCWWHFPYYYPEPTAAVTPPEPSVTMIANSTLQIEDSTLLKKTLTGVAFSSRPAISDIPFNHP